MLVICRSGSVRKNAARARGIPAARRLVRSSMGPSSASAVDHHPIPFVLQAHQFSDGGRDQQTTGNQMGLNVSYNLVG